MTAPPVEQTAAVVAGAAVAESLAAHRVDVETLLSLALGELTAIWQNIVTAPPDAVRDALAAALPDLAQRYGPAAATLGADWYDEMRDAAGVSGRFRAIPIGLPDQGRLDSLVGFTTQPLFPQEPDVAPDPVTTKVLLDGGFQRLVADMDRDTVRGSLIVDPQARGWSRQTTGKSCDFCVLLAGRGAVYAARTAAFSSHDNCDCIAVPVFGGDPRQVEPYTPSQKIGSQEQRDKNNRRLREYLSGKPSTTRRRTGRTPAAPEPSDVDAGRTVNQLRDTLTSLERSLERFDSPGTRKRVEELRRKIAARN